MNSGSSHEGSIVTFYSFKGGVGRTMALANISFLAARMGKRVLVMDWDLEAPGLAYYFKCLQDAVDARNLKDAPGILDLLWEWSDSAGKVTSNQEFEALRDRFRSGEIFERCVHPLLPGEFQENEGVLDFIGAGAKTIAACNLPYEDALAQFSWPAFFSTQVGGVMLEALRRWAKDQYDLIFLDSRTGLADVAGICTMQMPDIVALCFVLNRQNIDGVARVAHAIRTKRADQITLRALPLRVAARDSSEASDAQARAISELSRTGGFSREAAREDLRTLAVQASDTVPYYETLVPFLTDNPTTDPLTQNYAQTGSALLGTDITVSTLDPEWVELARSRLQARLATIEYVTRLRSSEPTRMVDELSRLIDNALEAVLDGNKADPEYVHALIAGIEAAESIDASRTLDMYVAMIDLLRALFVDEPAAWRQVLTDTLERFLDTYSYMLDLEEAIAFLEELDALLLANPTIEGTIRRLKFKREVAADYYGTLQYESCQQACDDILTTVRKIRETHPSLAPDQAEALTCAEIDAYLHLAYTRDALESPEDADRRYGDALRIVRELRFSNANTDTRRLAFMLNSRLAIRGGLEGDGASSTDYAIEAMRWSPNSTMRASRFGPLARAVLKATRNPREILRFCQAFLPESDSRSASHIATYLSRSPRAGRDFLDTVVELGEILWMHPETRGSDTLRMLVSISNVVTQTLKRRTRLAERNESGEISALSRAIEEAHAFFERIGFAKTDESDRSPQSRGRIRRSSEEDE
jgi:hypothetical protein